MDEVPMYLKTVASMHKLATTSFHGRPEVSLQHDLLQQQHVVHMGSTCSSMDLEHKGVSLLLVHTPQKQLVVGSLVQVPTSQHVFGGQMHNDVLVYY